MAPLRALPLVHCFPERSFSSAGDSNLRPGSFTGASEAGASFPGTWGVCIDFQGSQTRPPMDAVLKPALHVGLQNQMRAMRLVIPWGYLALTFRAPQATGRGDRQRLVIPPLPALELCGTTKAVRIAKRFIEDCRGLLFIAAGKEE